MDNSRSSGNYWQETAIWWIRRDLRLTDNQALAAALSVASHVIPVFVLDPSLLSSSFVGEKRLAFLFAGLRQLDSDLKRRGGQLITREGYPVGVLASLAHEVGARAILAEEDYSPYARRRDREVGERLPLQLVHGLTVHPPGAILKADGAPYTVFTPYRRKWREHSLPSAQSILPAPDCVPTLPGLYSHPIPSEPALPPTSLEPGEEQAARCLREFLDGDEAPIYHYGDLRDRIDLEATSRLSPYLRFGMLSARQAVVSALTAFETAPHPAARASAESWLDELVWREFYIAILYHFPRVMKTSFRADLQDIRWSDDHVSFRLWCEGRTGFPVVDAAMRQLSETGSMPNRARMIVASYLVKDLLVDWRWGERWFMQHLIDGDPAANNGGWQWTAGTGTDAAPYFRIFNPVTQAKKHDPYGDYVRRWVPELARVPVSKIHEPWKMDAETQRLARCIIGRDYPTPMVDHAWARERVLEAYAASRSPHP